MGPASHLAPACPEGTGLCSAVLKSRDEKHQPEVTQQAKVPTSHMSTGLSSGLQSDVCRSKKEVGAGLLLLSKPR